MPARARIAKGRLALIMFAALSVPAGAAETAPPAAPAPAVAAPAQPSPAAIAAADKILGVIGLKESIAIVVPRMMAELETNVTRTRPEIRDSLRATLKAIQPEFDRTAKQTSAQAAEALRPIAGVFTFALFAAGIIGIGLLAVPVLAASGAYALGEALGWTTGLERKPLDAKAFYVTI